VPKLWQCATSGEPLPAAGVRSHGASFEVPGLRGQGLRCGRVTAASDGGEFSNGWKLDIEGAVAGRRIVRSETRAAEDSDLKRITAMVEPKPKICESPPADRQYYSLGWMAQFFQRPVEVLRMILAAAGVKPDHSVNDVLFYTGPALLVVRDALEKGKSDA